MKGFESRISDYDVTGNQVILQIDSVNITFYFIWMISNKYYIIILICSHLYNYT